MIVRAKLLTLVALALALVGCGNTKPTSGGTASLSSELSQGPVSLVAQHSAKCIQVSAGFAVQQTCTGATAQQWSFKPVTGGYQISSVANPGQCLNLPGASTTPGQQIAVSVCSANGAPGEIWSANPVGSTFNLVATHSGQCMDINGVSTANGAVALQWTCNGQANQLWALQPVASADASADGSPPADAGSSSGDSASDAKIEGGTTGATSGGTTTGATTGTASTGTATGTATTGTATGTATTGTTTGTSTSGGTTAGSDGGGPSPSAVTIVAQHSGKCVQASAGAAKQQTCTGAAAQQWSFKQVAGGYQIVSVANPGQCLNLPGASTAAGQPIAVSSCSANGVPGEIWSTSPAGNVVSLVATHSGQCMDVNGVSTADGAVILQWTCNGQANQHWALQALADAGTTGATTGTATTGSTTGTATTGATTGPATTGSTTGTATTGATTGTATGTVTTGATTGTVTTGSTTGTATTGATTGTATTGTTTGPATGGGTGSSDGGSQAPSAVTIVAQHSGKCVQASAGAATQQTCTGSSAQQWTFKAVTGGYQIVSVANSGQCLNLPGASTTPGQAISVSACSANGVPGEIWNRQASGNNFNLVATHSGQCMDVNAVSTADGAIILQWTCNGQTNQLWALQPVATPDASADGGAPADAGSSSGDASAEAQADGGTTGATTGTTTGGTTGASDGGASGGSDGGGSAPSAVTIVAQHSGKCVQASAGVATQQTCTGSSAQQWTFKAASGGYQIMSLANPGQCLNLSGASTAPGQQISVSGCSANGVPGEIWNRQAVGNNFNLVATHSGQCMDVSAASTADDAVVQQWTCNGQANQLWALPFAGPPLDPTVSGQWSSIIGLPSIPVAAAALPNGKILTWASWEPDNFGGSGDLPQTYTNVFDPQSLTSAEAIVTQTGHDMFCPGTAMLGDGRVFVNGGGPVVADTSLYDGPGNTWTADALMNQPRWYNTSVTLPDGRVFTLGGNRLSGLDGRGEIWTPGVGWQVVPGAAMDPLLTTDANNRAEEHPRLFVAPNGKIFVPGPTPNMQWYDLSGSGSIQPAGIRGDDTFSQNDLTVVFDVGKLLKAGGNTNYDGTNAALSPSSANAYVIDINSGTAIVHKTASLSHARAFVTGVVLPDGKILAIGGLDNGKAFSDAGAVYTPEVFDPATETWRDLQPMATPRTYHSMALLIPDGRIFVGGGGLCGTGCAANHSNAEIFSPPYLFQGPRPQITNGPSTATYGSNLAIATSGTVTRFSWVRMSSVTHAVNTDQRWLPAPSTPTGGGTFSVTTPANANVAPPGYYMLFALNGGVPSVAQVIRVGP